jgi:hypothetical protein
LDHAVNIDAETLAVANTVLNASSIACWLWVFYKWLGKGDLVTRRENTIQIGLMNQMLEMKNQTIDTQAETIKEQREQITDLLEVGELVRDLVNIGHERAREVR